MSLLVLARGEGLQAPPAGAVIGGSTHTALGYIDSRSNVLTWSAWSYLRSTQHYPSNERDVVEVYSTRPGLRCVNTHGVTVAKFHPITNPTPKGSRSPRNFLQAKFLTALAEDFERDGAAAIKICRIEEPAQYVKIVASLMQGVCRHRQRLR